MAESTRRSKPSGSARRAAGNIESLLDREETRSRVLSAAAGVFANRGVDDATVEDILRAAELSRGTFYKYFSSKYDVLKSLFEVAVEEIYDTVTRAALAVEAPEEGIRAALEAYVDLHREAGGLVPVLQTEAVRTDSPLAPVRRDLLERLVGFFQERFQALTGRQRDPLVFYSLLMSVEGLMNHLHQQGDFGDEEARRARQVLIPQFERTLGIGRNDSSDATPESRTAT